MMRLRSSTNKGNKWQMMLYIALLVIVIVFMVTLGRCSKSSIGSSTQASGGDTLDVAIEYSPITYYTYDDTLGGYNHDLLILLESYIKRPIKLHPIVALKKGLDGLDSGLYDVLVAQFPTTRDNREHYIFTQPVYIDQQVLVQRKGYGIDSQLDLAGDTVYIVKGSPMLERIASLSREIGDTIHVAADAIYGPEQLVMLVASGDINLAVVNKTIASSLATKLDNIDASVDISLTQFQAWALKNNNVALRDSIDTWLNAIKRSGRLGQLQERYFGKTLDF